MGTRSILEAALEHQVCDCGAFQTYEKSHFRPEYINGSLELQGKDASNTGDIFQCADPMTFRNGKIVVPSSHDSELLSIYKIFIQLSSLHQICGLLLYSHLQGNYTSITFSFSLSSKEPISAICELVWKVIWHIASTNQKSCDTYDDQDVNP